MINKPKIFAPLFLAGTILATSVYSATVPQPGAIGENTKQSLEYYEFQKRLEKADDKNKKNIIDEAASEATVAPKNAKLVYVNKIITNQSDILTQQEISHIIKPYEDRNTTITELFGVVNRINDLYREKNYPSAKAVLPPQKVVGGVIEIKLIESRIGDLLVENNESTSESYITDRLNVNKGELVELDRLESELFYFNSVNDIKIRAVLKPGSEFATTNYILQAEEPPQYQTTFFLDNTGTNDTGEIRGGVNFINNSLTGRRDVLTAGANFTQGIKSSFLSYNTPISSRGTRLGVSVDYTDVDVIDGALEPLNITGASYNVGGFVTHPFIVRRNYLLNGFVGLNSKNSRSDFDGVQISETDVGTASFGVEFNHYGEKGPLYSRFVLTTSDEGLFGADQSYTKFNGELSKIVALEANVIALLRFSAQLSDSDLLPSSEQFQVGGVSTVRGYPSGLLSGDEGYFASAEVSFPLVDVVSQLSENSYINKWRGIMFVDHGAAFPFKGNNIGTHRSDYISSVGLGINMNISKALSARLVLAAPVEDRDDGQDKPMLHFYISYIAF